LNQDPRVGKIANGGLMGVPYEVLEI